MPLPRLAITLGDPCGIGPELLLKSLPEIARKWQVRVYGSRSGLAILPEPGIDFSFRGSKLYFQALEVLWIDPIPEITPNQLQPGAPSSASGRCACEAVKRAALDIMSGEADALLTLPLSKAAAHLAGYRIQGHTELLQEATGSPVVRMAFLSPTLNVALHTVHQSLRSAIEGLDAQRLAETMIFAAKKLGILLKAPQIKIGLCAINPHAGESGAFGDEERILEESIELARAAFCTNASGPNMPIAIQPTFSGPYPADTIFQKACRKEFDVVVALFHDQGLLPIKLLEPERAVNLTLGLPFVRVSPDHGTAFDIAGKWLANPNNTLAAADLALSLLR